MKIIFSAVLVLTIFCFSGCSGASTKEDDTVPSISSSGDYSSSKVGPNTSAISNLPDSSAHSEKPGTSNAADEAERFLGYMYNQTKDLPEGSLTPATENDIPSEKTAYEHFFEKGTPYLADVFNSEHFSYTGEVLCAFSFFPGEDDTIAISCGYDESCAGYFYSGSYEYLGEGKFCADVERVMEIIEDELVIEKGTIEFTMALSNDGSGKRVFVITNATGVAVEAFENMYGVPLAYMAFDYAQENENFKRGEYGKGQKDTN